MIKCGISHNKTRCQKNLEENQDKCMYNKETKRCILIKNKNLNIIKNNYFGDAIEYIICKINNIEKQFPKEESKLNKEIINNIKIINLIKNCFYGKNKRIPMIYKYSGLNNGLHDFILRNRYTLSVKTNIKSDKVAPQTIGQSSYRNNNKFIEYFGYLEKEEDKEKEIQIRIKILFLENKKEIIYEMFKNLFSSTYLLYIKKDNENYESYVIKNKIKKIYISQVFKKIVNKNEIILTKQDINQWNNSNTIKIKNRTIGEFQIHNTRKNIAFRFNMTSLLNIEELQNFVYKCDCSDLLNERKINVSKESSTKDNILLDVLNDNIKEYIPFKKMKLEELKKFCIEKKIDCNSKTKSEIIELLISLYNK